MTRFYRTFFSKQAQIHYDPVVKKAYRKGLVGTTSVNNHPPRPAPPDTLTVYLAQTWVEMS